MENDIASSTPQRTWENLKAGNARYAADAVIHPRSSADRRADLREGQDPKVAIFSCGDSRVPAEMVFDMGLGDAFIIRNAGHIVDESVLASVQFAVDDLNCNLLVVMGHQSCGAVKATFGFLENNATIPVGFQRAIVEKISLTALAAKAEGKDSMDDFERRNTLETVKQLMVRIPHLEERVLEGTLGIVGIRYLLDDGTIEPLVLHGVS